MSDKTGAVLRVHRSNFSQSGFVTEPSVAELVSLRRGESIPVIDDIGSGCLYDLSQWNCHERTVADSVRDGADLTLFSGDKLFGGPQAGIIVGKRHLIDRLRKHPMTRALRLDKMTLAGLEITTQIHLSGTAEKRLPLYQAFSLTEAEVRARCENVLPIKLHSSVNVSIQRCESRVGGGTLPDLSLPSVCLKFETASPDSFAQRLREQSPSVVARIHGNAVLLDLRTVQQDELPLLKEALQNVANHAHSSPTDELGQ